MMTSTSTVQAKVKTDWQQVQTEGGQRLGRIREIFKVASSEALGELKAGSSEIQTLSRKSLAEMLTQLKETPDADVPAPTIVLETEATTDATDLIAVDAAEAEVPTWRQLFLDFWHVANDRKGEWSLQMLSRLRLQLEQFDADMVAQYEERYRPFRRLVSLIRALVEAAYSRLNQGQNNAKPVSVEVVDSSEAHA